MLVGRVFQVALVSRACIVDDYVNATVEIVDSSLTTAAGASLSMQSAFKATASPPADLVLETTSSAAFALELYVRSTLAPRLASSFAIPAPIPLEPPVTMATLF